MRAPTDAADQSQSFTTGISVRPQWKPRSRRMLALVTVLAVVLTPPFTALVYWRYVNAVPSYTPALPAAPLPNGYDYAARALERLLGSRPLLPKEWRTAPESALAPGIAAASKPLSDVRRAFGIEWLAPSPLDRSANPSADFSPVADYFAAESRLRRLQGDPGGALRCSLDAMELGLRVVQSGAERFNAQSHQNTGMEQAQLCVDVAPRAGLAEQLARLRRIRLAWPRVANTLEIDRQIAHARLTKRLQEVSAQTLWQQLDEVEAQTVGASSGTQFFGHGWSTWRVVLTPRVHSLTVLDQRFIELKARASAPVRDGYGPPPLTDTLAERFASGQMGGYRWEWPRQNLALLEAALAVRLYRLEHGHYPAQLREIEPERLPEIPLDIWDQPVAYRLRNGRPVIYSLAGDGVDDGGKAANPYTFIEHGTGDAVWGKLCASDWPPKR